MLGLALKTTFAKDPVVDRSLRASIKDGVFFSTMVGTSESYFGAYAVLLKASAPQVGLLASLPPLLAAFGQILSVWASHRLGFRNPIIIGGALIQVLALALLIVLPDVGHSTFPLLLAAVVLYFVGPNIGAPLWAGLMGQLVPESSRGRFFARRTRLSTIASFSGLIIAGGLLQWFDQLDLARYGFTCIFAIGLTARLISAYYLSRVQDPQKPLLSTAAAFPSIKQIAADPAYLRFTAFFAMMQFSVAISGPFVVVYLLTTLHYSYLALTLNTAASVFVQFVVLSRWGRLSDLFGNRIILRVTGFSIPFVPLLWTLNDHFSYLIGLQMLSGLIWSGFTLSANNALFDLTTGSGRTGRVALHNLLSSFAVFSGAAFGSLILLNWSWIEPHLMGLITLPTLTFTGVFLASATLRLATAAAFLPRITEPRAVRRMTYHGLIFRVTRFSPISGVIFEGVTRVRKRDDPTN